MYFIANTLDLNSFNTTLNVLINLECWKSSVSDLRLGYTPAVLFYVSSLIPARVTAGCQTLPLPANTQIQKYIHTFLFLTMLLSLGAAPQFSFKYRGIHSLFVSTMMSLNFNS